MSGTTRPLLAALALLAIPVAAFLHGRPRPLPPADFTFVLPQENSTVDPAAARTVSDAWVVSALFDSLTRLDPETLEPRPGAARAYEVSEDGRRWTFAIDPEARWSDGRPVTAGDFVHGWRRVLGPSSESSFGELLDCVEGAREWRRGEASAEALGVAAPDDGTFVVRLRYPVPYFASLTAHFAFAPARPDLVGDGRGADRGDGEVVGNGPYRLELRRVRDRLRFRRNEHHPRGRRAAFDIVEARVVEEPQTAVNLYLTGAVDWVNAIPSSLAPRLAGRDDFHVSLTLSTTLLRLNVTRPPLDDPRVRRALDLALDRDALCRFVYRAGERPARSFVPPGFAGYSAARGGDEDAAAARALLAEAGFPGGDGFPELELLHTASDAYAAPAEAIARQLAQTLGVRLRAAPQEHRVCIDSQKTLRYDVCLANWVGDYPDPTTFLDIFRAGSPNNRTGWADPEYDAILDRAAAATNADARADLLRAAEARLLEAAPLVPICYRSQPNLVRPDIRGFSENLLDLHPLEALSRAEGAR